jgi:hypothetical protein
VGGYYYHIGLDGQSSLRLENFTAGLLRGPQGAMDLANQHIAHAIARLAQADFSSAPLGGKCTAYCAAVPWCWRFKPE